MGAIFTLYPLSYYMIDVLNYSQTAKNVILGFLTFTTLFYWRSALAHKFSLNPIILITLIILSLNIAFQATVRDVFGVQQDDIVVIQSIFSTDVNESTEFFIQYWRYILVHFIAFSFFTTVYWLFFIRKTDHADINYKPIAKSTWVALSCFTFLLVALHFNPGLRRGNPLYYFPYYYNKWQIELANAKSLQLALAKTADDQSLASMHFSQSFDKNTLVLVIGESDTRHNWSLYGYQRKTNPELEKLRDQLWVFKKIKSADASTVGSITKIFTPATLDNPNLWKSKPGIVTIAKHLGYKVIWITNQGIENTGIVSILAAQADSVTFTNQGGSRSEGSHDEVVFAPYEQAIADPATKKLIVVHILGAHPAYNFRYPESFAAFEDRDDAIHHQLIAAGRSRWAIKFRNYYDSALLYEDFVLSNLLKKLIDKNDRDTSWLYLADHGEDVVHHNDFSGHNHRAREMWEIPFLFWSGKEQFKAPGLRAQLTDRSYRADIVDHTILGLLNIHGDYYQPELDLFSEHYDTKLAMTRVSDQNL